MRPEFYLHQARRRRRRPIPTPDREYPDPQVDGDLDAAMADTIRQFEAAIDAGDETKAFLAIIAWFLDRIRI